MTADVANESLRPLIAAIESGKSTIDTIKTLRNLCAKGASFQTAILSCLPDSFFESNLRPPILVATLELCNNLCVQNSVAQLRLFPLIAASFPAQSWTVASASAALMFTLTCTQPGSPLRPRLTLALLSTFLPLFASGDDDFDFLLVSLLPPIAVDLLTYALAHPDAAMLLLDRLHDAVEFQPQLFDPATFVPALLGYIAQETLPVTMAKSKIIGIFTAIVGSSGLARAEAHRRNAMEVLLNTKKVDINDPILLEWSAAALRVLMGDDITD
jgi:hypothetical protein